MKKLLENKLWVLDYFLICYLVLITFFEKPQWCIARGSAMTDDCQEDIYGNKFFMINLISFTNKKVFLYSALIMIYFNLKHYVLFAAMQRVEAKGFLESDRKVRVTALTALNLLHFLFYFLIKDNIIAVDGPSLVKTFAILIIVDWLYFTLKKIVRYMVNFYEVFLFFVLNWLLVAAVLEVLFVSFPQYYDHPQFYSYNFTNYFKSLFSVFVFFTTNNSPEIMMREFAHNKFVLPLFVAIVFVNNLLLVALVIGLSYYKMKLAMAAEIASVASSPEKLQVFQKLRDHPDVSRTFIKSIFLLLAAKKDPQYIEEIGRAHV